MRKIALLSLCLCGLMLASSCGGSRQEKKQVEVPAFRMTAQDTLQVLALADSCMKTLKDNRLDDAVKMIYTLSDTSLIPLDETKVKAFKRRMSMFPVLDYSLDIYFLRGDKDNELKYEIKFENSPSFTAFRLVPVFKDNRWYLTIDDKLKKRR